MDNYLNILAESLEKKIEVLSKISVYNEKQKEIFQSEQIDMSLFDQYVDEKGQLIAEISKLDEGFQTLYNHVALQLQNDKEKFVEQIQKIQASISEVTELSIAIQTQEARNKKLIEDFFVKERTEMNQNRKSSKAALDYYRKMNKSEFVAPQFIDNKK